jgi:hypothetical protein
MIVLPPDHTVIRESIQKHLARCADASLFAARLSQPPTAVSSWTVFRYPRRPRERRGSLRPLPSPRVPSLNCRTRVHHQPISLHFAKRIHQVLSSCSSCQLSSRRLQCCLKAVHEIRTAIVQPKSYAACSAVQCSAVQCSAVQCVLSNKRSDWLEMVIEYTVCSGMGQETN